MSPILVRPVREQLEHDRIIRLLQVRLKRKGEVVANIALCLIHQANFLLDQQVRVIERDFLKEGGLRERMTRARLERRKRGE